MEVSPFVNYKIKLSVHLLVVSSVNRVSSDLATLAVSSLSSSANRRLSVSEANTSIDQASEPVSETSSRLAAEADPRLPLLPSTSNEKNLRIHSEAFK